MFKMKDIIQELPGSAFVREEYSAIWSVLALAQRGQAGSHSPSRPLQADRGARFLHGTVSLPGHGPWRDRRIPRFWLLDSRPALRRSARGGSRTL